MRFRQDSQPDLKISGDDACKRAWKTWLQADLVEQEGHPGIAAALRLRARNIAAMIDIAACAARGPHYCIRQRLLPRNGQTGVGLSR